MTWLTLAQRDRRALKALGIALGLAGLWLGQETLRAGLGRSAESLESLEQRYLLARQELARRPAEADRAAKLGRAIGAAESRMLRSATPALAQAELRSLARDLLRAEGIESSRSEFGAAPPQGGPYEAVTLELEFRCAIGQLVGFLAAAANARPMLATRTCEITSLGPAAGQVQVRLGLEGYLRAATGTATAGRETP